MSMKAEQLDEARREAARLEQELAEIARDKQGIKWTLLVGVVAAPALWLGVSWIWGVSALALSVVMWGTAHYMFAARRAEFEEHLERTRAEQAELERAVERAAAPLAPDDPG